MYEILMPNLKQYQLIHNMVLIHIKDEVLNKNETINLKQISFHHLGFVKNPMKLK